MTISIRRTEPSDYKAVWHIFAGSHVVWGTLQVPFPSVESWRKRLSEPAEGVWNLVAQADSEVVGQLGLHTLPYTPRRRHVGAARRGGP